MYHAGACWLSDAALSLLRQVSVRNTHLSMLSKIELKAFNAVTISAAIGCFIALANSPAAQAQSADLVLCDRIAADPSDPDKPADVKGVAEIAPSDIATAIKFCQRASGSSRRALYQLGRAYAANRQMPEAIGVYRKAAEKGSSAAMVELGTLLVSGSGGPGDETEARALFARAAQAGDARAAVRLAALPGNDSAPSDPAAARALLAKAAETNS